MLKIFKVLFPIVAALVIFGCKNKSDKPAMQSNDAVTQAQHITDMANSKKSTGVVDSSNSNEVQLVKYIEAIRNKDDSAVIKIVGIDYYCSQQNKNTPKFKLEEEIKSCIENNLRNEYDIRRIGQAKSYKIIEYQPYNDSENIVYIELTFDKKSAPDGEPINFVRKKIKSGIYKYAYYIKSGRLDPSWGVSLEKETANF